MSLPLLILLPIAGPLLELRVADVDGQPGQELVLASQGATAGEVLLEVVALGEAGEAGREGWPLPARPGWWDAGHGLWLADGAGLRELGSGRVLRQGGTGLPAGGRGEVRQAGMVVDLDHDDQPELLLWTPDAVEVFSAEGRAWGQVPTPPRTVLERQGQAGGQVLRSSLVPPAVSLADVDGDGDDDVLVIDDQAITVHRTEPGTVSAEQTRWPLPAVLAPPPTDRSEDGGWTTDAHWGDLTGDGIVDLLVHRLASQGKLASTASEVHLFPGHGWSGLGPPQVVASRAGAQDAFPVDLDADGDQDVLVPRLRLDVGNLAQAVVSRTVEVELAALPMEQGRLGEPVVLRQVSMPLEGGEGAAWSLFEDLTGDGLPDLALAVGGTLQVFPGEGLSVARRAVFELDLPVPVEHLWAVDLTGDGAAELVAWAPGTRQLAVVKLR